MLLLDVTKQMYSYDSQSKEMDSYDSQSHATKLPRGHTILIRDLIFFIIIIFFCLLLF